MGYPVTNTWNDLRLLPRYEPSERAQEFLIRGNITSEETPQELLEKVIHTIFSIEHRFGTPSKTIRALAEEFAEYVVEGYVLLGIPQLMNANRCGAPLSSCVVMPVDLQHLDEETEEIIRSYYQQNMGIGFDFTRCDNPIACLSWINELAIKETAKKSCDRPIGNMGTLHVSHPSIREFINVKRQQEMTHFNISVDVPGEFIDRAERGERWTLLDGTEVEASDLLEEIAENAWYNGDPGLIFLERMNQDNPIAGIFPLIGTPPCAEMGLAEQETAHFGYINFSKFRLHTGNTVEVHYTKLRRVTELVTRVLDNAIEYSLPYYLSPASANIARMKRTIAIGGCGLADLLIAHTLPYDSIEARALARDILSYVNYISKHTSHELAKQRGSCLVMKKKKYHQRNSYIQGGFLENKFARRPTQTVSSWNWKQLARTIQKSGKLRNITTTALAPAGGVSFLLGVTSSIEPMFSIASSDGILSETVQAALSRALGENKQLIDQVSQEAILKGSFRDIETVPLSLRECLKTAKELSPMAHIQMVEALAGLDGVIDESASKTINLSNETTVSQVKEIFISSYRLGLKNISVYRDKTKADQPKQL